MPRLALVLLLILMLAISAAPTGAQEDGLPDDQQALLDQLREAFAAAQEYDSFVTTATGSTSTDQIVTIGDSDSSADQSISLDRVTHFTHDADGAANAQSTFEIETTGKPFDQTVPVTATIHAEVRLVAGAVYVRAEGEVSEGAEPPLLPDGWVQLTRPGEWPALSALSLERVLENPTQPDMFDASFYSLLDHASEVWSDAPDAHQIGVRVAGEDLVAALIEIAAAEGQAETMGALYEGLTEGTWEITVDLDDAGQIARIRTEGFMQWIDFDLTLLQPAAPVGSLLTQFYLNESEVVLSEVNVPREPVEAPPLGES